MSRSYVLRVVALFLTVLTAVLARSRNGFLFPILHCEDGTIMFSHFLSSHSPLAVFRFYAGYVSLLPNIIGYVSARFPPTLAPYVMAAYCMLLTSAGFTLFALQRYRAVMPDDAGRVLVCLCLALVPLGNFALHTSTTYSLWTLLWLLVILAASPPPRGRFARAFQVCVLSLAACSHPLSIVILPVLAMQMVLRRSAADRAMNAWLTAIVVVYQIFGVRWVGHNLAIDMPVIGNILRYFMHRVVFESVFGNYLRVSLFQAGQSWLITLLAAGVLAALLGMLIRRERKLMREDRVALALAGYVVFSLTSATVVGKGMDGRSGLNPLGQRFFYVQQLVFVLCAAWIVGRAVVWERVGLRPKVVLVLLVSAYLAVVNSQNAVYFLTARSEGRRVAAFLRSIDSLRRGNRSSGHPDCLILERGGGWDISVAPRGPVGDEVAGAAQHR